MARKGKEAKNVPDSDFAKLRCPYTCLRPLLGTISMILFLVCLHSLIYDSFIAYNSPDCSKCYEPKSRDCKAFCATDAPIEDFVYITDTKDRNKVLVYFGISLLLRCIAFMAAFIGAFVYILYALVFYLVIHLGLEFLFIGSLIFHASKGERVFELAFGRSTPSIVVWSLFYTAEGICILSALILSYKYMQINCKTQTKNK